MTSSIEGIVVAGKRQHAGHIISVSSVACRRVGPGFAVYAATTHAGGDLPEGPRQAL